MGDAEDMVTLKCKARMKRSDITGSSTAEKKCRDALNYSQRAGLLSNMDMNGASHASAPPGMQRANKKQHQPELGNDKTS